MGTPWRPAVQLKVTLTLPRHYQSGVRIHAAHATWHRSDTLCRQSRGPCSVGRKFGSARVAIWHPLAWPFGILRPKSSPQAGCAHFPP